MAINVSDRSGCLRGEINVTPLVDVVLVLLIIFMVVTPMVQSGYGVQVPPRADGRPGTSHQIIVRMDAGGRTYINQRAVPLGEFAARLSETLTGRTSRVIFFAADGELPYEKVVDFMDLCVDAGAEDLGIVFEDLRGPT